MWPGGTMRDDPHLITAAIGAAIAYEAGFIGYTEMMHAGPARDEVVLWGTIPLMIFVIAIIGLAIYAGLKEKK